MEEEIKSEFEKSGFSFDEEEDQTLQKCLTFCINYKLSPSDLVSSWEIYYLNRQLGGSRVENAHMDGFLLHLQMEQKDTIMKEETNLHVYSSNDVDMLLSAEHEGFHVGNPDTPPHESDQPFLESHNSVLTPGTIEKASTEKSSRVASNRMTPFGQRMNKFVLQSSFNSQDMENEAKKEDLEDQENDVIRRVQPGHRCSLQVHQSQPKSGCRFLYDRIEDKFNFLENHIRRKATALAKSGLYEEPTDATLASQKSVFAVGMVCCEGEGHLNEKSLLLQGSVEHSLGQRVRLDVQNLSQFSLFPGQVIGIEGNNPSGHCLIASQLVDSFPLSNSSDPDMPPEKKQAMDPEQQSDSSTFQSKELSLVIAAGPFTTTDNLLFEPLSELLSYASRKQPQLLILLGPFIDSEHPEIKKGTANRSFDEIFHVDIIRRLQDYAEYMGSVARVILVPSTRDAHHHFVFPQPAFDIQLLEDLQHQITFLANPSLVSANEIMIGCCTVDILKHLSSEEISRTPPAASSGDRMGRLATHLLNQHRQVSVFLLKKHLMKGDIDWRNCESLPLDLSVAPEALEMSSIPDVLILPSDLAPFVKVLSTGDSSLESHMRCIGVNPGRLAKGVGGGTFVEINYNGCPDKTSVSIVRI
ncbi:hypothetical protein QJS10_CPA16g00235 [Acorus calamus]|uniref:DNA polymerase alpha subunit B n=1 Tax=Acorus calamus TaxID=4465 RepID=A0AAV9D2Q1_ACOCL|nr:hypothetical protein QJS10_CPA16g00235 [Acorus calamus]